MGSCPRTCAQVQKRMSRKDGARTPLNNAQSSIPNSPELGWPITAMPPMPVMLPQFIFHLSKSEQPQCAITAIPPAPNAQSPRTNSPLTHSSPLACLGFLCWCLPWLWAWPLLVSAWAFLCGAFLGLGFPLLVSALALLCGAFLGLGFPLLVSQCLAEDLLSCESRKDRTRSVQGTSAHCHPLPTTWEDLSAKTKSSRRR